MGPHERVHTAVPSDEEGSEDEDSCKEWKPQGVLVGHVVEKKGLAVTTWWGRYAARRRTAQINYADLTVSKLT